MYAAADGNVASIELMVVIRANIESKDEVGTEKKWEHFARRGNIWEQFS